MAGRKPDLHGERRNPLHRIWPIRAADPATVGEGGENPDAVITLDLLPEWEKALFSFLLERRGNLGTSHAQIFSHRRRPQKIGPALHQALLTDKFKPAKADSLSDGELAAIAAALKGFPLPTAGTLGWRHSQVTAGSIDCAGFCPRSHWKANEPRGSSPPGRFSTLTETAAASICNGPGLPDVWPPPSAASGLLTRAAGKPPSQQCNPNDPIKNCACNARALQTQSFRYTYRGLSQSKQAGPRFAVLVFRICRIL